jgi:Helix-turn-helix domain
MAISQATPRQATPNDGDEVLTLHGAAKVYKVSEKTMRAQALAGLVPYFKVGKQYRFLKSELLASSKDSQAK